MQNLYEKYIGSSKTRLFGLLMAVSLLFRLPSLFMPYADVDEIDWGLFANALVDGHAPYHTVMGEKPPLLYLFYALIFNFFGKHNYLAIHIAGIFLTALTAFAIYKLTERHCQSKKSVASYAAIAYIIFGSAAGFRMQATTGELMMNLPLVLSCLFFLEGFNKRSAIKLIMAGLMAATAALFRQQALIQFGAFLAFLTMVNSHPLPLWERIKARGQATLLLGVGGMIALTLCAAYIYQQGALQDFLFWVFRHNYSYIKSGFLNGAVLRNFFLRTSHVLVMTLPIWILAMKRVWKTKGGVFNSQFEALMFFYLIVSIAAVLPGGRFFPHYFLQAFPALCILAAMEFYSVCHPECNEGSPKNTTFTQKLLHKLPYIYIILLLLRLPLVPLEMHVNDHGDYAKSNEVIGNYLKQNTNSTDKIFIWGWSQGIYYYSNLDPASRFISADFLSGRSPSQNDAEAADTSANITPGSWDMLFADFGLQKPRYILDTSPGNNHGYGIYPLQKFPQLFNFLTEHYQFEKRIEGIDLYRLKD